MKQKFFFILIAYMLSLLTINSQTNNNNSIIDSVPVYKLYPTENMWTFIKLNTSTGQLWQVHYAINDDTSRSEELISLQFLSFGNEAYPGRFSLYPTKNTYNFILLDHKDGRTWQVQWSFEYGSRMVIPIKN